jgi:hypothetical protein
MGKKAEIPLSKLYDYLEMAAKTGVWGGLLINFEEGRVTKIIEEFVWTGNDIGNDFLGPSRAIKMPPPRSVAKKKLVVKTKGTKQNGHLP